MFSFYMVSSLRILAFASDFYIVARVCFFDQTVLGLLKEIVFIKSAESMYKRNVWKAKMHYNFFSSS